MKSLFSSLLKGVLNKQRRNKRPAGKELLMKIHTDIEGFEYWYDRAYRCWFAAPVDADGNLGPTVDAYTKRDIVELCKEQAAAQ